MVARRRAHRIFQQPRRELGSNAQHRRVRRRREARLEVAEAHDLRRQDDGAATAWRGVRTANSSPMDRAANPSSTSTASTAWRSCLPMAATPRVLTASLDRGGTGSPSFTQDGDADRLHRRRRRTRQYLARIRSWAGRWRCTTEGRRVVGKPSQRQRPHGRDIRHVDANRRSSTPSRRAPCAS